VALFQLFTDKLDCWEEDPNRILIVASVILRGLRRKIHLRAYLSVHRNHMDTFLRENCLKKNRYSIKSKKLDVKYIFKGLNKQ